MMHIGQRVEVLGQPVGIRWTGARTGTLHSCVGDYQGVTYWNVALDAPAFHENGDAVGLLLQGEDNLRALPDEASA